MKSLLGELRVILVVSLTVFGYGCLAPNIASAQCAWILWENLRSANEKGQVVEVGRWEIVNGYPRYDQCLDRQREKFLNYEEEQGYKVISIPFGYVWRGKEGGKSFIIQELKCLPDTIDPRK